MLFAAYFDGSGKLHDPKCPHIVLAGVVLYANEVEPFGPSWVDCLRHYSQRAKKPIIDYFHAKEAFNPKSHRDNPFFTWKDDQIKDLLLGLARLTRDRCFNLICAPASSANYKALPSDFKKKLQGVNELSFEVCVNELLNQIGKGDQLHIVCDDEEDESVKIYKFLCRYKQRYLDRRDRFVAICFADDKYHPALQAADLFAYVQRREWDRKIASPGEEPHYLVGEFNLNGSSEVDYEWAISGDGLGSAKRLVVP